MVKDAPLVSDASESALDAPTPVKDALDVTGGPQFVIDQMSDVLERARIAAQGRTDDMSVRWGAEEAPIAGPEGEPDVWVTRFWVGRDSEDAQHGLTVDEAAAALGAMGG